MNFMYSQQSFSRRQFLRRAAQMGLGASLPLGSLLGLVGCRKRETKLVTAGYGPLSPVVDETTGEALIKLPAGFRYRTLGWTGVPLSNGGQSPDAHDGMGIVAVNGSRLTLVRNHEILAESGAFGPKHLHYDQTAAGGCVAFEFDTVTAEASNFRAVLSGTMQNCSGGITPWGTWLSCEESVFDLEAGRDDRGEQRAILSKPHGFVFEVDPAGIESPKIITGMGAFKHEAAAVHAATGSVYLTEDFHGAAGFYRYVPTVPGQLTKGGRLQMLAVKGRSQIQTGLVVGESFHTSWLDIKEPTRMRDRNGRVGGGVFEQGQAAGGAAFTRLEGCFAHEQAIFFTATDGGDLGNGQVFVYFPNEERLMLLYESQSVQSLDYPDNLCVSPRGGLILCEDNGKDGLQRLIGMTADGLTFNFAENNVQMTDSNGLSQDYRSEEWCGACFSPDGRWLFANIYRPGFTVAITGPWGQGIL